ncbi:Histone acetylase complex subunit mrg15-2 [Neofusicoccum parvum]|uniref:Histone acetylase complex subunit mrg15-2 n=1 Tax=Neofusicoccum parvum TaxID=310453 RepID=A0ACB5RNY7_9PEZI|nr:Histone acetylase complex subunit mrg15-2 [Neofusicoccum parvum]
MFAKDEKALCFHHELLYEAKVLDVKLVDPNDKKSAYQYKVHYKGWKATFDFANKRIRWDDWVPQDRLRKLNDENRELANSLKKELEAMRRGSQTQKAAPTSHKKKPEVGSTRGSEGRETPVQSSTSMAGRKRGRDFEVERSIPEKKATKNKVKKRKRNEQENADEEEAFRTRPAIRLHMPDRLKSLLVDDWENITKNLQLVKLPVEMPVSAILDMYHDYEAHRRPRGSAEADILEEIIAGVKEYFNKALGRILLYRFERDQYLEIYKKTESPTDDLAGKTMSEIYGGEHLLRLFVSLPELIAQTNMDPQSVNRLREELHKINMWLSKDETVGKVFVSEYETADSEYVDKAKGDERR